MRLQKRQQLDGILGNVERWVQLMRSDAEAPSKVAAQRLVAAKQLARIMVETIEVENGLRK